VKGASRDISARCALTTSKALTPRARCRDKLSWRASKNDRSTVFASPRREFEEEIGGANDVGVVLDNDNRMAPGNERSQGAEEFFDIGLMKPGGQFIRQVDRMSPTLGT